MGVGKGHRIIEGSTAKEDDDTANSRDGGKNILEMNFLINT